MARKKTVLSKSQAAVLLVLFLLAVPHLSKRMEERETAGVEDSASPSQYTQKSPRSGETRPATADTLPVQVEVPYHVPRWTRKQAHDQLLYRYSYTVSYNRQTRCPNWVGWVLTADHTDGKYARGGHQFKEDKDVPLPRARYSDIRESECGYQRGHMCPAQDNKWAYKAQKDAFLMTNICPQNGDLNQRDWKYLEEQCRKWASAYDTVYIVAGPVFHSNIFHTVGKNGVGVPDAFFKVVYIPRYQEGNPFACGFLYENKAGSQPILNYARSVKDVEEVTGLDFFYQLPDETERRIEECVPERI